ncbi:MAG: DUF4149 domain-containing protein [Hydrogenothermaceae bacterium]|nr:DUF4149 domain-containing protein [Hydrogenothermaceae bacterium]
MVLSLLFGGMIFFTFIVGPVLFSNFDSKLAGSVMNLIFPYYFKIQWIGGIIIYTLIGIYSYIDKEAIKRLKLFLILVGLFVIIGMALDRAIYPTAKSLLLEYYNLVQENHIETAKDIKEKFDTFHKISSTLNMINIIIMTGLIFTFLRITIIKPKS